MEREKEKGCGDEEKIEKGRERIERERETAREREKIVIMNSGK